MRINQRICFSLLMLFFFFSATLFAQQPAWIDYARRNALYPPSEYLVGFESGENSSDEDPGKLLEKYESLARDNVVESILVSIESNNAMHISNVNGKTEEEFLSKSVSFSKATINGLRTDRYYDKKKKLVYAIAYVNIKKLAYYYKDLLSNNVAELEQKMRAGRSFIEMDDKENALRSFYEGMPLLSEIDEAQMLLIALNKKEDVDRYSRRIHDLRIDLNESINQLQESNELSLSETAYFLAYGLFVQLQEEKGMLAMDLFTYENTGLSSAFSRRWNDELADALLKVGLNHVRSLSEAVSNASEVGGNYWTEGTALRIHARVLQNGDVLAVSEGSIPLAWLKQEGLNYSPPQLEKVRQLDNVHLLAINPNGSFKIGKASDSPLMLRVVSEDNGEVLAIGNMPIRFVEKKSRRVLCKGKSDQEGVAKGFLPAMTFDQPVLEIEALIDVAEYADLDTTTLFFNLYQKQNKLIPARFEWKANHQTFYVNSEELLMNKPMEIKTIEPVIKEYLTDKGYHFTDVRDEADQLLRIKASTTTGTVYQGIYFAYVDANLSIVDQISGEEVFKTHIDQIKGGGANYDKAGRKAYILAADKLKQQLTDGW